MGRRRRNKQLEYRMRLRKARLLYRRRLLEQAGEPWKVELPEPTPEEQIKHFQEFTSIVKELERRKIRPVEERVRTALIEEIYGEGAEKR
jgi:hypothetical protein